MQPRLLNLFQIHFGMKTFVFMLSLLFFIKLQAQDLDSVISLDTIPTSSSVNTIPLLADSLAVTVDSITLDADALLSQDSIPISSPITGIPDGVVISQDAIDAGIAYTARDSIVYDILDKKIYLYGDASVQYEDLDLKAGYIIVDWDKNEVFAEHTLDSLQKAAEIPNFKNADQEFDAKSIRYNFKSKKGIIYDAKSKYDDLFILGSRAKFLASDNDSLSNDHLYSSNALFTSCNLDHPHYGIRSKKQKIIPNKVVVIGPSNVEIMGVPTPLVLPFGFFPISETRTAGLIFPQDFTFSPQWGFGLENVGYYTPINDNLDMSLTGDLYFNGTYGIHLNSNYKKIYKYNGNLSLNWSERIQETRGVVGVDKSFSIRWSHSQDQRAHPTRSFSGSMNIQTNDYQSLNLNDAESVLQNSLSSNINYRKSFTGKPYSFTATAGHSQNTRSNQVTINLPTAEFKTQNMFLFKRKIKKGEERWYEKISTTYNAKFRNQISATDTTLFTQQTLSDIEFGLEQNIRTNTSFKLFKFLSVNPSIQYREIWQPNTLSKIYEFQDQIQVDTFFNADRSDFNIVRDTVRADSIVDIDNFGFNRWNNYSGSMSINTQIFGTYLSDKGFLRGIRHLIKPSLSFSYSPSNIKEERGFFETLEYTDEFGEPQSVEYGVFEGGIFGSPNSSGEQANITYGINNIFEAKLWSKKDSTINKVKIFDNLRFSGSYNIAADSLNWSAISMSGTTRLFKGLSTINIGAAWSLYAVDEETGKTIDEFYYEETGKLARFTGGFARLSTTFNIQKIKDLIQGKDSREREEPEESYGTLSEIFSGFNFRHQLNFNLVPRDGLDSLAISTHSLSTSGSIQLTDMWNVRIGNIGYDFTSKRLTYPDLSFSRSLHCWETGISWQPFRGTYSFYLRVNPSSTLNFLKIPFNKQNVDGFRNL